MMRIASCLLCALAMAAACSWGGSGSNGGGGGGGGGVDAAAAARCGDGVCAASEVGNCPADCGSGSGSGSNVQPVCGNGDCEVGETAQSCPVDCGGGSGSGSGSGTLNCNDQNTILACFACIAGLGCTGVDMNGCLACFTGGSGCDGGAPDGICESDEDNTTCPIDCP